jgi:hypothetical protein
VIDAMTLFDVEELTHYWIDHPPLHLMVAAYLGIGKQRSGHSSPSNAKAPAGRTSDGNVARFLAEFGNAFSNGDVHAGLNPVVLDFAELRRKTSAVAAATTSGHRAAL